MNEANQKNFSTLAYYLGQRHISTMRPYLLFLGGASSQVAGQTFLDALRWRVLTEPPGRRFHREELESMKYVSLIEEFTEKWSQYGKDFQLSLLSQLQQKALPTSGYDALAALLQAGYFPLVLTTTLDQLLEATFVT